MGKKKGALQKHTEIWRTKLVREPAPESLQGEKSRCRGPADVARIFWELFGDSPNEMFVVFVVTTQHRVVGIYVASTGIVGASLIHPREVLRNAILANASAVILVHNHPSGDPTPSPEDKAVTKQMHEACKIVGIRLLDHVIVGSDTAFQSVTVDD